MLGRLGEPGVAWGSCVVCVCVYGACGVCACGVCGVRGVCGVCGVCVVCVCGVRVCVWCVSVCLDVTKLDFQQCFLVLGSRGSIILVFH